MKKIALVIASIVLSVSVFGQWTTSGQTISFDGKVSVGNSDLSTQWNVNVSTPLGPNAGNSIPLTRLQGWTNNRMMVNDFLVRESDGTSWTSASYVRGISVDNSFLDPTSLTNWISLRSWIKQFPEKDRIDFGSSGVTTMTVIKGGVGIGTTNINPLYKLDVFGTIHAQSVVVDLLGTADYVFDPSYKLMPLQEVEAFVNENKHLPEIPSAKEVDAKGLNIGEMQNKLLQKVEELTLYVIEQQKLLAGQQAQIEELKKQVSNNQFAIK